MSGGPTESAARARLSPVRALRRALHVLRREGPRSFWFKLIGHFGYRRLRLLERWLEEPISDAASRVPITIEWLREEEIDAYTALQPERGAASLSGRLSRGDRCLVARHDGRIVGGMWCGRERVRIAYVDQPLPLAGDEVYLYDAFTDPDFRGRGIAPALSAEMLRRARETGCRRAVRATSPENTPALRAHAKAGFRPCATIGRIRLGPWRWDFRRVYR